MFSKKRYNILITGANGRLGSYLASFLENASHEEGSRIGHVSTLSRNELDLSDAAAVGSYFKCLKKIPSTFPCKPDYIINCAAMTDTAKIEEDPTCGYAANVITASNIAHACAANGIKLIHISTDYVFSELSPMHNGELMPFPVNAYGMQKLLAEREVELAFAKKPKDFMTLRSSWMFGGNSSSSFVEKFICNLAKSNSPYVNVADDVFGKPTSIEFLASFILHAIGSKVHGNIDCQLSCSQITRCEWASYIRTVLLSVADKAQCNDFSGYMDAMCKQLHSVDVKACKSSFFGSKMRHPGRLKSGMFKGFSSISQMQDKNVMHVYAQMPEKDKLSEWKWWTRRHIESKFNDIVKMFNEAYEKFHDESLMKCNIENCGKTLAQMQDEALEKKKAEQPALDDEHSKKVNDRTSMLTVGKLVEYLKAQDQNACILGYEDGSCA